jgi:orotidine-5'-phosphate decarboxylase
MTMSFADKFLAAAERNKSLLCIGLDPDPSKMPVRDIFEFNREIIDATSDLVCAYKPNVAFYDALDEEGHRALRKTLDYIREHDSYIPIIGDSKRGDVQPTSQFHAKAMFEIWGFDAATVNPYGGYDAVQPFLDYKDRGIFVWCRSSNAGAGDFQDLLASRVEGGAQRPLYEWVALGAAEWNEHNNVGLVIGATYPEELRQVRKLCPEMPILIPGVGAQLGPLQEAIRYGVDSSGRNAIVNVSRSVLYASKDKHDFAQAARHEAEVILEYIRLGLRFVDRTWAETTAVHTT